MLKCLWNICARAENLWVKWVHLYFLKGQQVIDAVVGKNNSWIIQKIMSLREEV